MQKMRCFRYRNNSLAANAVRVISGRVSPRDKEALTRDNKKIE